MPAGTAFPDVIIDENRSGSRENPDYTTVMPQISHLKGAWRLNDVVRLSRKLGERSLPLPEMTIGTAFDEVLSRDANSLTVYNKNNPEFSLVASHSGSGCHFWFTGGSTGAITGVSELAEQGAYVVGLDVQDTFGRYRFDDESKIARQLREYVRDIGSKSVAALTYRLEIKPYNLSGAMRTESQRRHPAVLEFERGVDGVNPPNPSTVAMADRLIQEAIKRTTICEFSVDHEGVLVFDLRLVSGLLMYAELEHDGRLFYGVYDDDDGKAVESVSRVDEKKMVERLSI